MNKGKARRKPGAGAEKPSKNKSSGRRRAAGGRSGGPPAAGRLWLYGVHPVLAALENPNRSCRRLLLTAEAERRLGPQLAAVLAGHPSPPALERQDRAELSAPLPDTAVHQGLALEVEPLAQPDLHDLLDSGGPVPRVIVALDQVTDPQNVGAVLRSAAAFGALAVLAPERHAAPESGALAKAASGALERIPYVLVTNLARALSQLKTAGYWCLGLASEAERSLPEAEAPERAVLVLGAEGSGLRRLTREQCDALLRLPTRPAMGQLNVSNAAAVALYELLGRAR